MKKYAKHSGLYRPSYRDKDGILKRSRIWWMDYQCRGCTEHLYGGRHQESTGTEQITKAKQILDEHRGTVAKGEVLNANEILVSELLAGVLDYTKVHRKVSTFKEYEDIVRVHLRPYFAGFRAMELCLNQNVISKFIAEKQDEGYSASRINAMLQVLNRSFSLAENRISLRPMIEKLKIGDNSRKQFFTEPEYKTLCRHLPDDIRRPIQTLWLTGWRSWSEVFCRERRHLDLKKNRLILEPGEAKNSEPRIFPLLGELRAILEEQEAVTRETERAKGIKISWLFHNQGVPLVTFYSVRGCWKPNRYFLRCWKAACKASGLVGRYRHDFRRSAVRRFDALPDHLGMALTGHKSHSVYAKYKSTTETDLIEAVQKVESEPVRESYVKVRK